MPGQVPGLVLASGVVLRRFRRAAGLSQTALAVGAGLSKEGIARCERGGGSMSMKTLFRVSGAMGVRPSELVAAIEREMGYGR